MESLLELRKKGVIVAAHRGTSGGNVIQNTALAYINALRHGADMVEVDVIRSTDGKFYGFHDGQEDIVFGEKLNILKMSSAEIDKQPVRNTSGEFISQRVESLDFIFSKLYGKCWINIDRSWFYWDTFLDKLKDSELLNQLLLKAPAKKEYLDMLVQSGLKIQFMPIVATKEELDLVLSYQELELAAIELIFENFDSELLKKDTIESLKRKNILLWVNALTLNDTILLSAGLDDNLAIIEGAEESWGRLMDLGFDIIQTDWPLLLKNYNKG
ncbi:glycerophosphodiester phosphodiesterase family protein [Streptococcus panodentis]|uniref:Glycerophosphodiester phosphodiesterase n=1 Tax=Streptococcus panodentis TaxID=1581472 RepID=A0ABS5AXA7_9STRE|nr:MULTISPECIES: glycerophosphodiester phosphodiesterase family protein [Streptococcus]KXT84692.1 Glycerophosphoryl diester phosphodiesterase [Streptococcus sp. DD11]MBP2621212.1 glycerophosphodiester phosphodiesterase [Streptococcus panodentis]